MRERLLAVARGDAEPDLVVEGARVFSAFTREWLAGDVAVADGRIAGIGAYDGGERIDAAGRPLVPGFVDAHVHLESSKLLPSEFARAVVARGTTAVVCDPHEIANVLGAEGALWLLDAAEGSPLRVFAMAPSCVPGERARVAARARSALADMARILEHERAIGVAEVMDFPSVIAGAPECSPRSRCTHTSTGTPRACSAAGSTRTPRPASPPTTRRRPGRRRSRSVGGGSGCCCARPPTRATSSTCSSSCGATGRTGARSARTTASRTCSCARGTSTRCAAPRSPRGSRPRTCSSWPRCTAPAATAWPTSARSRPATAPTSSCSTTSSASRPRS